MGRLDKLGQALDWIERIKNVPNWVLALAPTALGAWGWLVSALDGLPFWQTMFAALALSILTVWLAMVIQKAWAVRGIKKLEIGQLGRDCNQFKTEIFDFLAARLRPPGVTDHIPSGDKEAVSRALHDSWARGVKHSNETRAELFRRFSAKVISLSHQLSMAGIGTPDLWGFDHECPSIAAYFGAVGDLLEKGLLEEAKQLRYEDYEEV